MGGLSLLAAAVAGTLAALQITARRHRRTRGGSESRPVWPEVPRRPER